MGEAVYGLPELRRAEIAGASLIANPGCYPTSIILGLAPLARAGWLAGTIIADSKSGVSGAGRTPSLKTHFVEANENLSPYSIGRVHRHLPEMEQELRMANGKWQTGKWSNRMAAHLLAASGADQPGDAVHDLCHLAGRRDGGKVREAYAAMYAAEPFVYLLPKGQVATFAHTANTNYCAIGLTFVPDTSTLIVTSSIDNLGKGASGQAVQNMNVMFGLDESTGLM